MDDSHRVRLREAFAGFEDRADSLVDRERAARGEERAEVLAVEMLHDHEREALVRLPDVVNAHDMVVLEPRDRVRLTHEAHDVAAVAFGAQHLDREDVAELDVPGGDHLPVPAVADHLLDAIAARDQIAFLEERCSRKTARRVRRRLHFSRSSRYRGHGAFG